jgi:hypothetical protein
VGHLTPHSGAQTDWLRQTLEGHSDRPLCLVAYHVPLFPGFRLSSGALPSAGRKVWQPLFEQFDNTVALEHHDDIFKRSVLIRGDAEAEDGISLYLGDAAGASVTLPAIDEEGIEFDQVTRMARYGSLTLDLPTVDGVDELHRLQCVIEAGLWLPAFTDAIQKM